MEQLGSHWTYLHAMSYLTIFRTSVKKIQVLLKSDKNNRSNVHFVIIFRSVLLRTRNVSDVSYRETRETLFFLESCRLRGSVEKYCRVWQAADDNIAHEPCMLGAKVYKYTLIIYHTYCVSTAKNGCTNALQIYACIALFVLSCMAMFTLYRAFKAQRGSRCVALPLF
jgi:hypothetical protein